MVVGEIGAERALDGLVVREGAREHFAERTPPVAHQGPEPDERCRAFARVAEGRPPAAEHAKPHGDPFGIAEDRCYSGAGPRKPGQQSAAGLGETLRKHEWRPDRPAANFVESAGRNPLHGVEHAGSCQHVVFWIAWIARVAGRVQGRLDDEIAGLIGGGRPAYRIAALEHEDLAPGAGKKRSRRKAAETRSDYNDVVGLEQCLNLFCTARISITKAQVVLDAERSVTAEIVPRRCPWAAVSTVRPIGASCLIRPHQRTASLR